MLYKDAFMFVKILTVFVLIFGVVSFASAHSGGTDDSDCQNYQKTGGYHCY